MLKLAILFSVVFLASAENAELWNKTAEYIKKNKHNMTDIVILEIESKFNTSLAHRGRLMRQVNTENDRFDEWSRSERKILSDRWVTNIRQLRNWQRCLKGRMSWDDEARDANLTINLKNKAEHCKLNDTAFDSAVHKKIKSISNWALDEIAYSKKGLAIGEGPTDLDCSPACCRLVRDRYAIPTIIHAADELARIWGKVETFMAKYDDYLKDCTQKELSELKEHSENAYRNTKNCTEGKHP